jgi:hypothetical protein
MKQSIVKFLKFKGKTLLFLSKNGVYWIAIKPVCEAIGVDYIQQFKNLNDDPILRPALCKHTMQVPGDQARNMVCLPERYIYGWIFSIRSVAKELIDYKLQCHDILYDHFHGIMTNRKDLLREKATIQAQRHGIEEELRTNVSFNKLEELRAEEARLGISLKKLDRQEFEEVVDLFSNSGIKFSKS